MGRKMIAEIDKDAIIKRLKPASEELYKAESIGKQHAERIDRIIFIGCGAPNRIMLGLQYWLEHFSPSIEVRRYFPAEFLTLNPPSLDSRTLVLLGSKSGTTPETVEAANFLKDKPCITIAVTQTRELPLAQAVEHVLLLGDLGEWHNGMFMVMQALIGGVLDGKNQWGLQEKLMRSLETVPELLAETKIANEQRTIEEARLYHKDRIIYQVASGPMFGEAYVFGVCTLMEMQWMHSYPIEAAEFFHGPFEIVDQNTPLVLMLGEDPSRPVMERVLRFCKKYTQRLIIYDSQEMPMPGIDAEIRGMVAPLVLGACLERLSEHLAVWNNHPLTRRRYMWKTNY
jgi:fructoselysine 6-phosphate deglycase